MPSTLSYSSANHFHVQKHQPAAAPVRELIDAILRATENAKRGLAFTQEAAEASFLLETLPLTTEEFGLANNRLQNANRYSTSGELGAARWELVMLRKALLRHGYV